jgi:excinuclease ABC subunit C
MKNSKNNKSFYPGNVPNKPGVYIFRDSFGKVIYIGKAVNLRRRISQYFQASRSLRADPKQRSLINSINTWECLTVKSESESLLLESRLIKQYAPYYNILMRDDKRYLLIKINLKSPFPKLSLVRIRKNDGANYYGPFPHGGVLRQTVNFLSTYFKLRLCSSYEPGENDRTHCMEARVKLCCEPCIGKASKDEYSNKVEKLLKVLAGDIKEVTVTLESEMYDNAKAKRFEKAAERRDMIRNITDIFGKRNRSFRFATLPTHSGSDAVKDLQKVLGLSKKPTVIEAFDVSNMGEQIAVASMVCFVNGRPDRKSYRRFKIKTIKGIDDFGMMEEVIARHFRRKHDSNIKMPGLVMVDGGKGQLSAALKALKKAGIPAFPVIGLAKKREEIFLPGRSTPIVLEKTKPSLKLLQAIRDEAHRFAVTYNREIRLKRINESILDDIPGIGVERKKSILKSYPSINDLRNSTPEEIALKVDCIGIKLAREIVDYLRKK